MKKDRRKNRKDRRNYMSGKWPAVIVIIMINLTATMLLITLVCPKHKHIHEKTISDTRL